MQENTKSKKIAKNSALLYLRMIVLMIINLYTVRVIINAIGIEDYGIYNVVAGTVTMFVCVSSVLATATQRFYSYSQGEKDTEKLKSVFSASMTIFILASVLVLLTGETIGLWFTANKLVISGERHFAALSIYQFSLFSFVLTLIQIPYSAAVIAHEDMGVYSVITSLEYLLKLGLALAIPYISIDKLIVYGGTLFLAQLFLLLIYIIYSRRHYYECHFEKCTNYTLYKDILAFSGWTFFGSLAGVGMNQVNTILVNLFFDPITNAARAISLQINGALSAFCNSFIMAVRPQMIKSYAEGNKGYLNLVFSLSNKFVYYMLFMICMPLIWNMEFILDIWLKVSDEQSILFSKLIVIYAVILALNNPISIVVQAAGKVRNYNVYVEIFTLLCPTITFVLFKMGLPAYTTYIAMIFCVICSHVVRLVVLKNIYRDFSLRSYLIDFLLKAIVVSLACICVTYILCNHIDILALRFFMILAVSIISTLVVACFIGLKRNERQMIFSLLKREK